MGQAQDQALRKPPLFSFKFVLPFGKFPPPFCLFAADIQTDFAQWPRGLSRRSPLVREFVSNTRAASPSEVHSCIFLFQSPCTWESNSRPKRRPMPTVHSLSKEPVGSGHSLNYQPFTLCQVIREGQLASLSLCSDGGSLVVRGRRDDFIGAPDWIKGITGSQTEVKPKE